LIEKGELKKNLRFRGLFKKKNNFIPTNDHFLFCSFLLFFKNQLPTHHNLAPVAGPRNFFKVSNTSRWNAGSFTGFYSEAHLNIVS